MDNNYLGIKSCRIEIFKSSMNICKKCGKRFEGDYCSNCGHPERLRRINFGYVTNEITSVLNFEKGFLFTVKELFFRPGKSIRTFISEDRNRLMKPMVFILITSLIYALIIKISDFEGGAIDGVLAALEDDKTATVAIFNWIQENYGYANLIMAIFIGLWLKVFFKKYQYNFFEILILLCFVMGTVMLIYTAFTLTHYLSDLDFVTVGILLGLFYATCAIGQFFDKRKAANYFKAFMAYVLGTITFTFVSLITGFIIDMIK